MKHRRILFASLVATLCAAGAHAQPMGPHHMRGGGPPGPMMGDGPGMMLPLVLKHANLTPEQTEQMHKIMDANQQSLQTLLNQLQAANDQLADKLFAPGAVQAADLAPQAEHIAQLRRQVMDQGIKTSLAIRAILTNDQLVKVAQLKDRIEKLHSEMRSIFEGQD